jgi:DNA-binding MarR family transcriptional regulator
MEKVGWVGRADDPRDGRVGYVVLTAAGRRLVKDGAKTLTQQAATLFGDLWTDDELATLARLLGRLTANLPGTLNA